jgi:hypothetical protein
MMAMIARASGPPATIEKASAMKRKSKLTIAIAAAVLAFLAGASVYAQDKYSLQ